MTPAESHLPILGEWKLTEIKAARPDLPHPTPGGISRHTQKDDGIHMSTEGVMSDGHRVVVTSVYRVDGAWYPVAGSPLADSLSVRRLDDRSVEAKLRKDGVEMGTQRASVSADGRTLTTEADLIGPGGVRLQWTTTSERQ